MRLQTMGITLLISLTSVAGGAVQAAPSDGARQQGVAWRDLDLTTEQGTRVFWSRVRVAIRNVCDEPGRGLSRRTEIQRCHEQAVAQAARNLESLRRAQHERLAQADIRDFGLEGRLPGDFEHR